MSQKVTVQESPYGTMTEAVAGALTGKEDQLLSQTDTGLAVLFDGTKPAVAVMCGKLAPDSNEVRVRWLGKGGTVRVIQHAATDIGAPMQGRSANARVEAAAAGGRVLGYKLGPTKGGAAGDIIELLDIIERSPVKSADTLTALNFTAGGATGPQVEALRDAIKAILQAQNIMA
jgi:hypothetical protein